MYYDSTRLGKYTPTLLIGIICATVTVLSPSIRLPFESSITDYPSLWLCTPRSTACTPAFTVWFCCFGTQFRWTVCELYAKRYSRWPLASFRRISLGFISQQANYDFFVALGVAGGPLRNCAQCRLGSLCLRGASCPSPCSDPLWRWLKCRAVCYSPLNFPDPVARLERRWD